MPLAPTAARALLELRAVSEWTAASDPVFACPSTGMARAGLMARYRTALEAAGLSRSFSFHDLRHTFGTTMARKGVPVGTIMAWMGSDALPGQRVRAARRNRRDPPLTSLTGSLRSA